MPEFSQLSAKSFAKFSYFPMAIFFGNIESPQIKNKFV